MSKWPYELEDVPMDSYLFVANGIKEEQEEMQRQLEEAKKKGNR